MRLLFTLCFVASSAVADSSSLSLALPNPPMNYQSDSFSTGNMRCSNAVGGGVNLEYGVTGVLSGLNTNSRGNLYVKVIGITPALNSEETRKVQEIKNAINLRT